MKLVREGKILGWTSFFALEQTNGKGQQGKNWESLPGENLIMSTVADCKGLPLTKQVQLSCMVALACLNLLKKYGGEEFSIKWPNDIYWRDRKAVGILIENNIAGALWSKSIIGTGININQTRFGDTKRKAVSLKQITGKKHDPVEMGQELSSMLYSGFQEVVEHPLEFHLDQYNQHLYRKGISTKFKKDQQLFEATVRFVNNSGNLVICHGIETEIPHGGIEWLE